MDKRTPIKIWVFIFMLIFLASVVRSLETSSDSYDQSVTVTDGGTTETSSDNYDQGIAVGVISGTTSSDTYNTALGFFHGAGIGNYPFINLFKPINNSFHTVSYVLLNFSVSDEDNQPVDIYLWAANSTEELNNGKNSLVKVIKDAEDTSGGYNVTYNFTSPVVQAGQYADGTNTTVLLMHLDNRSQFGETTVGAGNKTYDFSGNGNDGTIYGATFNETGGKFAGAFNFDGDGDFIDCGTNEITGTKPFTLAAWFKTNIASNKYSGAISIGSSAGGQSVYIGTVDTAQVGTSDSIGGGFYGRNYGTGISTTNTWVHVVLTFSGGSSGTATLYVNSEEKLTDTYTPNLGGTYRRIGRIGSDTTYDFSGTIDEVAIWNRSLSAQEIKNLYELKSGKYYWKVNATDSAGLRNESETWLFTIDKTLPRINSSINDSAPKINEVINLTANVSDDYELRLCQFINNQSGLIIINETIDGRNSQCSQNFTIDLPRDSVINFTVIVYDTANNTNQSEHIITVANTPPPKVTLLSPESNSHTINRTPLLAWENVTDADGDRILFNLLVEAIDATSGELVSSEIHDLNTTNINTTSPLLSYLSDDNYFYNWSVRAIDNSSNGVTSFGEFSDIWNISVDSYVSLNLATTTVDFGTMQLNEKKNTTEDDPGPLVLENDGNVYENVSLYVENDLWVSESSPTDKFQFKADNTTEKNSFNWTGSVITFTDIPKDTSPVTAINHLNFRDQNDSAEIELKIIVPPDEVGGQKRTNITFEARRSK